MQVALPSVGIQYDRAPEQKLENIRSKIQVLQKC